MDPLATWSRDIVRRTEDKFFTPQADLYAAYASWAKVSGIRSPMTLTQFVKRLDWMGLKEGTEKDIRVRYGLLLITDKKDGGY